MSFGTVLLVQEVTAGSELSADAATGAATITVEDPTDFSEDGGTLLLGAETIVWTGVDETTATITLATTLSADHAAGDRVDIQPATLERFAYVAMEEQEEVLEVLVPHSLYDRIQVGQRDEVTIDSELVELSRNTGGELVVVNVVDQAPSVDGSFIDTATLPPAGTDGSAPASSPTPTVRGGIGSLAVSWTPISNSDPVTYEVHVDVTSGFTPSGSTLAGETGGSLLVVHRLPADGSVLDSSGATTYYVRIVAKDADGSASAGTEAFGTPRQADTPDIAVEAITADQILANSITSDQVAAVFIVGNRFVTATEGQRVEMGPDGVKLYASDGTELVSIPTDPSQQPTFRGDVVTGGLTVTGGMVISGASNIMDKGSVLELQSKVADPGSQPTLNFGYGFNLFPEPIPSEEEIVGLDYDANGNDNTQPTYLMLGHTQGGNVTLYEVDATDTSTILRSDALFPASNAAELYGVARCGSYVWVLYKASTGSIILRAFDETTLAGASTTNLGTTGVNSGQGLGFGADGTNLLILGWSSGSNGADLKLQVVTISGPTPTLGSTLVLSASYGRSANTLLGAITGRNGDYTVAYRDKPDGSHICTLIERHITTGAGGLVSGDGSRWVPNAVSTPYGNNPGNVWKGITYDAAASQYVAMGYQTAIMQRYSDWVWTVGANGDEWWFGYTWDDSAGPHESGVSPLGSLTLNGAATDTGRATSSEVAMRGVVQIVAPPKPGDADQVNVYELPSSSAPASSSLHLQTPVSSSYSDSSSTLRIDDYDSGGAAPDTAHPFPGATSTIQADDAASVTEPWHLGGDGALLLTRQTVAQRPASPVEGDFRYNEDRSIPEFYDGTQWRGATAQIMTAAVNIASTAAHSSGNTTVTLTGLAVGDYCFHVGVDSSDGVQFIFRTESVCSTAGQILLRYFNANSATVDPASATHYFLVVRMT